jgi:Guanylate kinase
MSKIICISGESGSGKTTIAELLEKRGYNYIESYTTRPMRFQDEEGHIFVNMDRYNKDKKVEIWLQKLFLMAITIGP